MITKWRIESQRIVAMVGEVDVGAIYPEGGRGGKKTWWRMWVTETPNLCPVDGEEKDDALAKAAIEKRFAEFLTKAKLQPIPEEK